MTPERARALLSDQAIRGFGSELRLTDDERSEIWRYVQAAPISMSVRQMLCRIGRGEDPLRFKPYLINRKISSLG